MLTNAQFSYKRWIIVQNHSSKIQKRGIIFIYIEFLLSTAQNEILCFQFYLIFRFRFFFLLLFLINSSNKTVKLALVSSWSRSTRNHVTELTKTKNTNIMIMIIKSSTFSTNAIIVFQHQWKFVTQAINFSTLFWCNKEPYAVHFNSVYTLYPLLAARLCYVLICLQNWNKSV